MGSWKRRGNQYIQFVRALYCKLPTNGKQLPAFPLEAVPGTKPPTSEMGGKSVTTLPSWPPVLSLKASTTKQYHARLGHTYIYLHTKPEGVHKTLFQLLFINL